MRSLRKAVCAAVFAAVLGAPAIATATVPIAFDPSGNGGSTGATANVLTFDWAVNSALAVGGNPAGGLAVGTKVVVLSQARLAALFDPNAAQITIPSDKEFTFVAGFGEAVATCNGTPCNNATFLFDGTQTNTNYFEIWVKSKPTNVTTVANNLAGTGFNSSTRILYGVLSDSSGNFATAPCDASSMIAQFDQFLNNDWPGVNTLCGSGSTKLAVQVISIDPAYFPGFTPDQVANLKLKFNTSTIVPYNQTDPSRLFIGNSAGAQGSDPEGTVAPNLGAVNGLPPTAGALDFEFQSDANQAFEVGTTVPGACRVTYGGNDKNGNIDLAKFGSACSADKGNKENCYTFGGQVGAPTADPALGGPFGEHTHHQTTGPAGDFVFHAGTHSAPKASRITATACKDPGACRQAEANAGFKQIDFEGTGTFRTLDSVAASYLYGKGGGVVLPDNQSSRVYYFRVDMDDFGEPGNKQAPGNIVKLIAKNFLAADVNAPLSTPDPLLANYGTCNQLADVYQFYICPSDQPCEQAQAMYTVRGYLTGGNIQLHKVIK